MCVYVCWSTSTCISTTVKMNSEPKKTHRVLQKTAIHRKPQRYPAYPRNPQLQCCDRKCRASSTEMAVFFEGRQNTKFRRQHLIGGRGGAWPLWCGTSWDGCFFWRTRYQLYTIFQTHATTQKQLPNRSTTAFTQNQESATRMEGCRTHLQAQHDLHLHLSLRRHTPPESLAIAKQRHTRAIYTYGRDCSWTQPNKSK